MSDRDLALVLDEMERMLEEQPFPEDPDAIEAWRLRFAEAVASADRGPEWECLASRARNLGRKVEHLLVHLNQKRESLRLELDHQAQGSRALRAYRPAGN